MLKINPKLEVAYLTGLLPQFETWMSVHRDVSASTFTHHSYNIRKMLSRMERFNKSTVENFVFDLKKVKQPGTVENYVFTVRVFCNFLQYMGILKENFGAEIPLPKRSVKVPTILTVTEIEKILHTDLPLSYSHYPDPKRAKFTFDVILSLLAKTGARESEVLNIRQNDINWDEGVWTLNQTKTRTGRLIPIPPDDILKMRTLVDPSIPDQRLFVNPMSGLPISIQTLGVNFRTRLKKAGITKTATIHTLRHSFITELLRQDVSVLKIANIVGHENIKTTQEYAKLLYEDLRDAIMRHPITAKNRNPYDILKHVKETILKFHLKEDSRFFFEITDMTDGVKINIFLR